jgi:diguanylate cyclase (GGDEF)-like protein
VQFSLLAKLDVAERRLRELSTIDDLTGVFNRRGILELADMEIARAKRLLHPMSVALLDIDNFKKINDVYGHAAGDLVLQRLAELCKKNIREIDRFARYGGEEFVFILPEANSIQATEFTDRIRKLIENSTVEYNNHTIRFSVSIGVASLSDGEDLEKLMLRSDNALYEAKRQGKNVTVCAEVIEVI